MVDWAGAINANLLIVDYDNDKSHWIHNTITQTHRDKYASFLKGDSITTPTHIALGNSTKLATEDASRFTKLKSEMARAIVSSKALQAADTVRFVAVITGGTAVGEINETGLFNTAQSVTVVDAADSATNWSSSDGTLVLDNTTYREGTGALKTTTTGDGAVDDAFTNSSLTVNTTAITTSESISWFQGWYFVDSLTNIDGASVEVRVYTGGTVKYYAWTLATSGASPDLVVNWNWLNLKFSDATKSGAPDITTETIQKVQINSTKDNTVSVIERIDHLRVFVEAGDLWAWAQFPTTVTKTLGTTVGVYWFLSMREGGSSDEFTAFARESVTVQAVSRALTPATHTPTGGAQAASKAIVTVRSGGPINWTVDGTAPTISAGQLYHDGAVFTIHGITDITAFRAIKDTQAVNDAILEVEYLR